MAYFSFSQTDVVHHAERKPGKFKVVSDPIHQFIPLDDSVVKIIDTPEFQRLRDLKQLGTAYYVFPGASHNRFEHSLGVSHLSRQLIDHLHAQQPELCISDEERMYVRIAGLCHDLGHGPFSHVFDGMFIPAALPGVKWHHEDMSLALLDFLLDENHLDLLDDGGGRQIVKDMIHNPEKAGGSRSVLWDDASRRFLFEIVANGSTGIDTDKFDYIARDTHSLGLHSSFDRNRLLYSCRVFGGRMAYHQKEVMNVYDLFQTRYRMFRTVYLHRASKAIEFMVTDVLLEADAAWGRRLSSAIHDPRAYAGLTDCLLREIETSTDPALARARTIVRALRTRHLYRFVDEYLLPVELTDDKLPRPTPEDLTTRNPTPSVRLDPALVVVHDLRLDYGMRGRNPVEECRFFRDPTQPEPPRAIPAARVSHLLPAAFQERVVRVYSKVNDDRVMAALQGAFRHWVREHCGPRVPLEPDAGSRLYCSQGAVDSGAEGAGEEGAAAAAGALGGGSGGLLDLTAPLPARRGGDDPAAAVSSQQRRQQQQQQQQQQRAGRAPHPPAPHSAGGSASVLAPSAPPVSIYGHNNPSPYRPPRPTQGALPDAAAAVAAAASPGGGRGGGAAGERWAHATAEGGAEAPPLPLMLDVDDEGAGGSGEGEEGAVSLPSAAPPQADGGGRAAASLARPPSPRAAAARVAPPVAAPAAAAPAAAAAAPAALPPRPRISDFFGKPAPASQGQEAGSTGIKRPRNA